MADKKKATPTIDALAKELGVTPEQMIQALRYAMARTPGLAAAMAAAMAAGRQIKEQEGG